MELQMASRKSKKQKKENAEYDLKPVKFKESTKRLLALDPGSTNMGISILAVNEDRKVKVVANSIITKPVHDLVCFNESRFEFLAEITRWIELYDPQVIFAERFQPRGIKGKTVEAVNLMIGMLSGKYEDLDFMLVTAGTWKNAFHRRFKNHSLDHLYKLTRTTPHALDSILLGLYCAEKGLQVELDYDPLDIVKQAEATSAVRLINKRR
jgi:hypothetical protein